jgi:hypothetical protein
MIGGVDVFTSIVSNLNLVALNSCAIIIWSLCPVELNVVLVIHYFFDYCLVRSKTTLKFHLSVLIAHTVLINGIYSELVIQAGLKPRN